MESFEVLRCVVLENRHYTDLQQDLNNFFRTYPTHELVSICYAVTAGTLHHNVIVVYRINDPVFLPWKNKYKSE